MSAAIKLVHGTLEYLRAKVTADVDLDMGVELALLPQGEPVTGAAWLAGEWSGDLSGTRWARTIEPVDVDPAQFPTGGYALYVRLDDTPEKPILPVAGTVTIVASA